MNGLKLAFADLQNDVKQLQKFKREVQLRNLSTIAHEAQTLKRFDDIFTQVKKIIEGCLAMMEADSALSDRIDTVSVRLDTLVARVAILERSERRRKDEAQEIDF